MKHAGYFAAVLTVLCAVVACGTLLATEKDAGDDMDRIKGNWNVTEMSRNGEPVAKKIIDAAGYVIGAGEMTPTVNGAKRDKQAVMFKLIATTHPKQIDLVEKDSGETSVGIYELNGDRLKLCFTERPKELDSSVVDSTRILILLKRNE